MTPFYLSQTVNAERFREAFQRRIPPYSSELMHGQVYGTMRNESYFVYVELPLHGFRSCISEYLLVNIDADGRMKCQYKRTFQALLLAVFAPISLLIASILLLTVANDSDPVGATLPMAFFFSLFNFFRSDSLRSDLLDAVSRVAKEAERS